MAANDRRIKANNAFGLLGAAMLIGDTTISFAIAPNLPTVDASSYLALTLEPDSVNEEIVHVTAFTPGNSTATIVRGREGTTARQHSQGVIWLHGPTGNDFPDSIFVPPMGSAYDDEFAVDGTLDAKWGWVNQSNGTVAVARSRLIVTKPSNGTSISNNYLVQTAPAAPYEFTTGPLAVLADSNAYAGPCIRGSASGRHVGVMLGQSGGSVPSLLADSGSQGSFNADLRNSETRFIGAGMGSLFLRIKDDGTTYTFSYSFDGVAWRQFTTMTRAAWLTDPNQVGFVIDAYAGDLVMSTDFFRRTT
jgi:hypothetical protein